MITLSGFTLSNYFNKVKMVLIEKGIPYVEEQCAMGGDKTEEMLMCSPLGKVPYIRTEQGSLCESEVIVEYLEALHPQPPPHVDEARPLRERWIGIAIVAGTLAKVLFEAPWDLAPRPSFALGIAVAPIAHACGLAAGLLAWAGLRLLDRRAR